MLQFIIFSVGMAGLFFTLIFMLININKPLKRKAFLIVFLVLVFSGVTGGGAYLMVNELKSMALKQKENKDIATIRLQDGQTFSTQVKVDMAVDPVKDDKQNTTITFYNAEKNYFDGVVYLEIVGENSNILFKEKYPMKLNGQSRQVNKIVIDKGFKAFKYEVVKNATPQ